MLMFYIIGFFYNVILMGDSTVPRHCGRQNDCLTALLNVFCDLFRQHICFGSADGLQRMEDWAN
jgi:hypothetical protein